jgi:tetratricopeptide (TPR) repeat protein
VFRERVEYSKRMKEKLAKARETKQPEAVRSIEQELGIADTEAAVVIDLMLSYRAVSAWQDMVSLVDKMSAPLKATVMVREQLALALNRLKRRDEAERVLSALIEERGPSSETLGILGRVYKDRWQEANKAGDNILAQGYLQKAIDTYLAGFESDWRDAYPGINAVTLMNLQEPPDPRRTEILPVVRYAVQRKMARGKPDYWDYATLLELAILEGDEKEARRILPIAYSCVRESWEPETTVKNLGMIREARERLGTQTAWATEIEKALLKRAGG